MHATALVHRHLVHQGITQGASLTFTYPLAGHVLVALEVPKAIITPMAGHALVALEVCRDGQVGEHDGDGQHALIQVMQQLGHLLQALLAHFSTCDVMCVCMHKHGFFLTFIRKSRRYIHTY